MKMMSTMVASVLRVQGAPNHEEQDIEAEDLSLDVTTNGKFSVVSF
jgi:hypothetical protein